MENRFIEYDYLRNDTIAEGLDKNEWGLYKFYTAVPEEEAANSLVNIFLDDYKGEIYMSYTKEAARVAKQKKNLSVYRDQANVMFSSQFGEELPKIMKVCRIQKMYKANFSRYSYSTIVNPDTVEKCLFELFQSKVKRCLLWDDSLNSQLKKMGKQINEIMHSYITDFILCSVYDNERKINEGKYEHYNACIVPSQASLGSKIPTAKMIVREDIVQISNNEHSSFFSKFCGEFFQYIDEVGEIVYKDRYRRGEVPSDSGFNFMVMNETYHYIMREIHKKMCEDEEDIKQYEDIILKYNKIVRESRGETSFKHSFSFQILYFSCKPIILYVNFADKIYFLDVIALELVQTLFMCAKKSEVFGGYGINTPVVNKMLDQSCMEDILNIYISLPVNTSIYPFANFSNLGSFINHVYKDKPFFYDVLNDRKLTTDFAPYDEDFFGVFPEDFCKLCIALYPKKDNNLIYKESMVFVREESISLLNKIRIFPGIKTLSSEQILSSSSKVSETSLIEHGISLVSNIVDSQKVSQYTKDIYGVPAEKFVRMHEIEYVFSQKNDMRHIGLNHMKFVNLIYNSDPTKRPPLFKNCPPKELISTCSAFVKKLLKPVKKQYSSLSCYKLSDTLKSVPKNVSEHLDIPDSKVYNPSTILFSMIWLYIFLENNKTSLAELIDMIGGPHSSHPHAEKTKFIYLWCRFLQQIPDGYNIFFGNVAQLEDQKLIVNEDVSQYRAFLTPVFQMNIPVSGNKMNSMYPYGDVMGKKHIFVCDPCNPFHTIQKSLEYPRSMQLPSYLSQNILQFLELSDAQKNSVDVVSFLKHGISDAASQTVYLGKNEKFLSFNRTAVRADAVSLEKFSGYSWSNPKRIPYLWKQGLFSSVFLEPQF